MSQQEKLVAMLTEFGLPYETYDKPQETIIQMVVIDGHPKVQGYSSMVCAFTFDKSGRFQRTMIAE